MKEKKVKRTVKIELKPGAFNEAFWRELAKQTHEYAERFERAQRQAMREAAHIKLGRAA